MPGFPLSARLSEPHHYACVFDAAKIRVSTASFLVLAIPSVAERSRVGIVVAKKNVRRAVRRNRLKRIIREHFRQSTLIIPLDLVILARAPADQLSSPLLWKDLEQLWQRINNKAASL